MLPFTDINHNKNIFKSVWFELGVLWDRDGSDEKWPSRVLSRFSSAICKRSRYRNSLARRKATTLSNPIACIHPSLWPSAYPEGFRMRMTTSLSDRMHLRWEALFQRVLGPEWILIAEARTGRYRQRGSGVICWVGLDKNPYFVGYRYSGNEHGV